MSTQQTPEPRRMSDDEIQNAVKELLEVFTYTESSELERITANGIRAIRELQARIALALL